MYILNLVTKILHFSQIKVQGIKSARRASMQQCNYTTDGIFNLHMGCHSVHRGSGGGGIVYYEIQRIVHLFHVIHATDIHLVCKDVRTQKF